jgi:hypothetical protein
LDTSLSFHILGIIYIYTVYIRTLYSKIQ